MVSQNLELKANFPSVPQCDLILCDVVEQLKRGRRETAVSHLSGSCYLPGKGAGGRQISLTDTDFIFHDLGTGQSTFHCHQKVATRAGGTPDPGNLAPR